jgi:cohesin loading factor subunit SCC2
MALEIIEQSCCMLQSNKCFICLEPDATDAEPLVFSALEFIHAALAIMTHHDMPKKLYQEEVCTC